MLRRIRLPSVENVVAGSRFLVRLPIGPTYTAVHLLLTNITVASSHIRNLEFAINGRRVQGFLDAFDLDKLNVRRGFPAAATNGILTMHFRRPEMEEIEDASLFDIGTAKAYKDGTPAETIVETLTISGDLDSGLSSPGIVAYATTTSNVRPLGMIQKVLNFPKTVTISTSGTENEIDGFPIGYPNAVLLGMYLRESTAGIVKSLRATANIRGASVDLLENIPEAVMTQSEETMGRANVAGLYAWDLVNDSGQALDGLPLIDVGDLRIRPTCLHTTITTGGLTVYVDLADTFQGA